MVKKIIQRVIVGVLVSLILSFIYSLNSSALTYVQGTTTTNIFETNGWQCIVTLANGNQVIKPATITMGIGLTDPIVTDINACETLSYFPITQGRYYQINFSIIQDSSQFDSEYVDENTTSNLQAMPWVFKNNDLMEFVSIEERANDSSIGSSLESGVIGNNREYYSGQFEGMIFKTYSLTYRAKVSRDSNKIVIGDNTGTMIKGNALTNNWVQWYNSVIEFEGNEDITQFLENDKTENEQQGQESQDNADSSQEQTEENTQNLLGFLGSFFGAFTSAQATNCNMDWGMSQYGFGSIDMCSTNIPAVFSGILSIITLLIVLPMVLWLIGSIINAFKEFQE